MSKRQGRAMPGPGGLLQASQPPWSRMRELRQRACSPAWGAERSPWVAPGHALPLHTSERAQLIPRAKAESPPGSLTPPLSFPISDFFICQPSRWDQPPDDQLVPGG